MQRKISIPPHLISPTTPPPPKDSATLSFLLRHSSPPSAANHHHRIERFLTKRYTLSSSLLIPAGKSHQIPSNSLPSPPPPIHRTQNSSHVLHPLPISSPVSVASRHSPCECFLTVHKPTLSSPLLPSFQSKVNPHKKPPQPISLHHPPPTASREISQPLPHAAHQMQYTYTPSFQSPSRLHQRATW